MTSLGQTLGAVRRARATAVLALAWALCTTLAATAFAAVPTDGRVWELATTGPDNGVQLLGANGWTHEGDALAYGSLGPLPGAPSGELIAQSVATRTAQGWQTRRVGVPFTAPRTELFMTRAFGVSSDLRTWLWGSVNPLLPGAPSFPSFGLYRLASEGRLTLLGDLGRTLSQLVEDPEGVSDDTQHVALSDSATLLPEDTRPLNEEGRIVGRAAYEWSGTSMRLVGVEDGGAPISACGGAVVGNGLGDPRIEPNAMSRDGSKVFFTAPSPESTYYCPDEITHVYMRENGTHTVDVSASRCTLANCQGPSMMHFSGATPDGAYVFVTTVEQMIDEDDADNEDLYRIATATGEVTRISTSPPGARTDAEEGPIEVSDDGQSVAFVGYGELVPGKGTPEGRAVYLWNHGQLHFVGAITGTEFTEGDLKSANMSSDGSVLLFDTASQLLPSDTDESVDVYRYDVTSDTLTQVSLGTGGTGNGAFEATTSNIAGGGFPSQVPRTVSAEGSRVFFDTRESLLPEDVNDQEDVYEWHDGRLGLVSPGTAGNASTFQGIGPDGRDAFFMTDSTLASNDQDNGDIDIYDARIGGGFTTEPPPGEPPPGEPPPGGRTPPPGCTSACGGPLPTPGDGSRPPSGRPTPTPTPTPTGHGQLVLARMSSALRARLVHTGAAVIVVRGAVVGRLTLRGVARIGRRQRLVASGVANVRRAGTVSVRLRLTAVARRALRKRGATLRITLTVAQPGAHTSARQVIVLRGGS